MNEKQKILICGDVEGCFNALFSRVETINKKNGPFDLLLCVGNFFGVNNKEFTAYKNGLKKVCVPTYILGPNNEDTVPLYPKDSSELGPNISYLGRRGVFTSTGGLKIAYLSGTQNNTKQSTEPYEFNKDDVTTLKDVCVRGSTNYRGIDILLTSPWPKNVVHHGAPDQLKQIEGSELISWLALHLKPRYHISGSNGVYYERPPYRNQSGNDTSGEIATRFIALARVGNSLKQKWIYAASLQPVDKMRFSELYQKTTDETECPYKENMFTLFEQPKRVQYFYDMEPQDNKRKHGDGGERRKKKQRPVFDQAKCWFCLSGPEVEKHLVISVGNESYLALAKGGLVNNHLLISPIEHHQALVGLPEIVFQEVDKFKSALVKYFASSGHCAVFFERNYKTSHLQIHAVPIPAQVVEKLSTVFMDEAKANGIQFERLESHNRLEQIVPKGAPYFWVELPSGEVLFARTQGSFPLQFGREVLAGAEILDAADRIDWKSCILPRHAEEAVVQKVRKGFQKYDFTLE